MLIIVVAIGFGVLAFQLGAQRLLLVDMTKNLRAINRMLGQLDGTDWEQANEDANLSIQLDAGTHR